MRKLQIFIRLIYVNKIKRHINIQQIKIQIWLPHSFASKHEAAVGINYLTPVFAMGCIAIIANNFALPLATGQPLNQLSRVANR